MARILIIASFAPSLRNFRGKLLEEIRNHQHEVHVLAPSLAENEQITAWLSRIGVTCHDMPMSRSGLNPFVDVLTMVRILQLSYRIRPDVFFGYTVKPVIWGLLASRMVSTSRRVGLITGLGYAFTGSAGVKRNIVRKIVGLLYRLALKQATLLFFQNPDDRDEFLDLGLISRSISVKVVPGSGVDLEHYSLRPFPDEPFRFLLVARLLGDKGIREYVSAARHLRCKWSNVEFHLVGGVDPSPDGISRDEVAQWHSSGDIIWHGEIDDVRCAIGDAHVFVLPSYREGMPRTTLEAMSMGRPIVTTNVPGCRQTVVHGENGFVVPARDSASLAVAMECFLSDPTLIERMGIRSRKIAEEFFDVRIVNSTMLKEMELD